MSNTWIKFANVGEIVDELRVKQTIYTIFHLVKGHNSSNSIVFHKNVEVCKFTS